MNTMKKSNSIIIAILLSVVSTLAFGQAGDNRYHADKNLPFNQKAGEVNPQTGEVTLSFTDVALPGRAGMNFSFGRTWSLSRSGAFHMDYDQDIGNNIISGDTLERQNKMGVGWSTSLPLRLRGHHRCTTRPAPPFWAEGLIKSIRPTWPQRWTTAVTWWATTSWTSGSTPGTWGGEISYRNYYDDFQGHGYPRLYHRYQ
jgi:hypothetical protein